MRPPTTKRPPRLFPHVNIVPQLRNAELYGLPEGRWNTTSYSHYLVMHDAYVKLASPFGLKEYKKFVVRRIADSDAIRGNEPLEEWVNLIALQEKYSEFLGSQVEYGREEVHWLLIHRLQHERLATFAPSLIPDARFVFFYKRRRLLRNFTQAGIVQARVVGTSLWDMINHEAIQQGRVTEIVKSEFRPHLPSISEQLSPLLRSDAIRHVNWHIKNFIFNLESSSLFYVDTKPSNIFGRWRNEQNLEAIRRDFVSGHV